MCMLVHSIHIFTLLLDRADQRRIDVGCIEKPRVVGVRAPVHVHDTPVGYAGRIRNVQQSGDVNLAWNRVRLPLQLKFGEDAEIAHDEARMAPVDGDPQLALAHLVVPHLQTGRFSKR